VRVLFLYNEVETLAIESLSAALRRAGHETALLFDPKLFDFFRQEYNSRWLARAFSLRPQLEARLVEAAPDVVAFSVLTANAAWVEGWARLVRERLPRATIVAGGYHATASTEPMLRTGLFDWILRGEAEDALVELVDGLASGAVDRSIDNLAYLDPPEDAGDCVDGQGVDHAGDAGARGRGDPATRARRGPSPARAAPTPRLAGRPAAEAAAARRGEGRYVENPLRPYEQDLDRFGRMDKELFWRLGAPFDVGHMVEWRRGCPWGCTFCGNNYYRKIYYPGRADYMYTREFLRTRSVDDVLAELREIKARYDPRILRVNDDDVCADEAWLLELAEKMTDAERIPFKAFAIPNNVNERTVRALKRIGCAQLQMGVQSLNPRIRRMLGRPNSDAQIARAIDLCREHGIGLYVDQIFGLPGETEDDLKKVERFYLEHPPDVVSIYWLDIWAGADILQQAVDAGSITQQTADAIRANAELGDISTFRDYHNDFAKPYAWRIETRNTFGPRLAGLFVRTGLYRALGRLAVFKVVRALRALRYVNHLHAFPPARHVYDISWARFPRLAWRYGTLRLKLLLGLETKVPMVVLGPMREDERTRTWDGRPLAPPRPREEVAAA